MSLDRTSKGLKRSPSSRIRFRVYGLDRTSKGLKLLRPDILHGSGRKFGSYLEGIETSSRQPDPKKVNRFGSYLEGIETLRKGYYRSRFRCGLDRTSKGLKLSIRL